MDIWYKQLRPIGQWDSIELLKSFSNRNIWSGGCFYLLGTTVYVKSRMVLFGEWEEIIIR